MLTPRSRFTATACLLSTATGLFCGTAAKLLAETPAVEKATQNDVLQKLEEEYRRDGRQPPEGFKQQVEKSRRQQKRELELERRERQQEAKLAKPSVFQKLTGTGNATPAQTVGRSRQRQYQYEEQQQQQQQAQQPQQGDQASSGANTQAADNNSYSQPNRKLTKRERRELYRQRIAEQERQYQLQQQQQLLQQPSKKGSQEAAPKGPQQAQAQQPQPQSSAAEGQEPAAEQVPGPMEEGPKQPLPQLPLPQLPFTQSPAQAAKVATPTSQQPALLTPQSPATPAPVASQSPKPAAAPKVAAVPLLGDGDTEQEPAAPRASSTTRISAAPQYAAAPQVAAEPRQAFGPDKPYDRNRPYLPPTGNEPIAPPVPRNTAAVTRKAAVEVPLLSQGEAGQPETRAAEAAPSPYSGLKLNSEDGEARVARALGGPVEDGAPGLTPEIIHQELNKAPAVPDAADSTNSSAANAPEIPGVRGYCLVYLREHRQYVAGLPQFRSIYQSRGYTFSSMEAKRDFDKHPERYAPVQNGNDVVSVNAGTAAPGSLDYAAWYKGHLYLFSSPENMAAFWKSPKNYTK